MLAIFGWLYQSKDDLPSLFCPFCGKREPLQGYPLTDSL